MPPYFFTAGARLLYPTVTLKRGTGMDGNMADNDAKLAEAMRQQEVYERAMTSLDRKRRKQEMSGLAVMYPFSSLGQVTEKNSGASRRMGFVRLALVVLMGIFINYLFWTVALNG